MAGEGTLSVKTIPMDTRHMTHGDLVDDQRQERVFARSSFSVSPAIGVGYTTDTIYLDIQTQKPGEKDVKWERVKLWSTVLSSSPGEQIDELGFTDIDGDGKMDIYVSYKSRPFSSSEHQYPIDQRVAYIMNEEIVEKVKRALGAEHFATKVEKR